LKLKCYEPPSNFAFHFILRRYTKAEEAEDAGSATKTVKMVKKASSAGTHTPALFGSA
jgi:hypothetical protein